MELNLLIVDDEVQIRRGLEVGIPWKEHGVIHIFTAEDPLEGLQILKQQDIHILITDIRMPGMTGLEFAEKAKGIREEIRVILLSGYSEFEYAKKAIHIGVVEYLLKPVKIGELTALVDRIRGELETKELQIESERKQTLQKELERCLLSKKGGVEFNQLIQEYTGAEPGERIQCIIFALDTVFLHDAGPQEEETRKWLEIPTAGHCLKKGGIFVWFMVMNLLTSRDQILMKASLELSRENARRRESGIYTISGAAGKLGYMGELPQMVGETEKLLNFRLCRGNGIWVDGIQEETGIHETVFGMEEMQEMRKYVTGYSCDRARTCIQKLFQKLKQDQVTSYNLVKSVCVNLMQVLVGTLQTMGANTSGGADKNGDFTQEIPEYLQLDQYREWVLLQYQKLLDQSVGLGREGLSNVILTALVYIDGHYQEEITIDVISSYVRKSKNYFSTLFKREMGISFTEYLNRYRVEEAKKLLEYSLELNGEIATRVGFRDEKYFSAVFKKIEGCTPTDYRRKKGEK